MFWSSINVSYKDIFGLFFGQDWIQNVPNHDTSEQRWLVKVVGRMSVILIFFLLGFIICIGLHSKQITTGLEGTAADKPKQAHSCFSSCTEASQWEDISRSCFGRHHKTLLCAVLDRECRESVGCFRVQIRPWPKILCLLTSVSSLCLHLLKFCLARVRELYNTVKTKQVWALKN